MKSLTNFNWLNLTCNNSIIKENWHNEPVGYIDYHKCIINYSAKEYINTCDIVGITNNHYFPCSPSLTWLVLLENLSRFYKFRSYNRIKSEKDLVNLIHDQDLFPPDFKRVCEWNDRYYILTGHHRLTVAKFLNIDQVLVEVMHTSRITQ